MPESPSPHRLQRRLRSRQLTMIGIGGAIGTGLFLGSSLAISHAGPSVVLAYVLCGLVALVISWALAEMVVVHPVPGAFGAIAQKYLGAGSGFVVRWAYWAMQVIAIGGETIAAGVYVQYWWPQIPLWLPVAVFSLLVVVVNAAAVHVFGEFEYWFSMIKVCAIAVFVVLGLILVFFGLPHAPAPGVANLTVGGGFLPHGVSGLLLAMVFVLFSYIGTELVSVTAAESEDPARDIPRASRAMVLRLAVFYVAAMLVVVLVVPWTVTGAGGSINASPFVRVFAAAGVPAAATVMNFVVLTAALSSANANLYLTTRMLHSLAEHRLAPAWTGKLTRSGVPRNALVLSTAGLIIATVLSKNSDSDAYLVMFGISIFGAMVVWGLLLITHLAFRMRRRRAGLPPSPARLWGAPVVNYVVLVFLAAVLVSTFWVEGLDPAWKFGIPFFVVLVAAYGILRLTGRSRHAREAELEDSTVDESAT
ncbi:amino acid permease [Amycolatopsis jiangsuensis]|uniref:L-asparagine transporter-like permease n=1 Tax=Amycolatopsis jiangsuensis TaxID=1181879 RepID=A0A840J3L9_9PSEU|nr:amino acid permease [Amycolatopsis jiangsuensis]MBB4688047.1 L-asparagine transporter-like permease [Amycolatopsis jiangsuensis]